MPSTPPGAARALKHTFNPLDASIVEESGPLPTTTSSAALTGPGAVWSFGDNGEGWIGRAVALGHSGTELFAEFDTAADRVTMLSSFDTAPINALWNDPVNSASTNVRVHGSDETGLFVSCRQIPISVNGPRNIVVTTYGAGSSTPRWTWTFPTTTYGGSRAMVSRDGQRVVAAMLVPTEGKIHIAVFDHGSPTPTRYFTHQVGLQLQQFVISEDGHTAYVATTTGGYLFNLDTGGLIQQFVLLQSFAAQDISGDGSILAIGYFNGVDVWERQAGGNYARTWQGSWPGSIVCQQLDVSADSSTLVLGFGYFDQNLRVRIEAIDLRTKATTMVEEVQGGGTYQNVVAKIAASDDGQRFAVGLWGDQYGQVPELRIYRKNQSAPIATYDYPGSVYDLAISGNGNRLAVGTKSVHANLLNGGGTIDLYSLGDEDFVAAGIPRLGQVVDFDMWGQPNSPARLLIAPNIGYTPMGAMGTLHLRRTEVIVRPMSSTDSTGHAVGTFPLPTTPGLIGQTVYFQGFTTSPRRFTNDWVQLTVLP